MRGLIVYRSYFGNTKHVADVVAEELAKRGHVVESRSVAEAPRSVEGYDFIFVGSPTRFNPFQGRGGANGRVGGWLKSLVRRGFRAARPVVVFDTIGQRPKDPAEAEKVKRYFDPGAAGILTEIARKAGLAVYPNALRCEVVGMKGPLGEGEEERARSFAREFEGTLRA